MRRKLILWGLALLLIVVACSPQPKKILVTGVITEIVTKQTAASKTISLNLAGVQLVDPKSCDHNPSLGVNLPVNNAPDLKYEIGQTVKASCECVGLLNDARCAYQP